MLYFISTAFAQSEVGQVNLGDQFGLFLLWLITIVITSLVTSTRIDKEFGRERIELLDKLVASNKQLKIYQDFYVKTKNLFESNKKTEKNLI